MHSQDRETEGGATAPDPVRPSGPPDSRGADATARGNSGSGPHRAASPSRRADPPPDPTPAAGQAGSAGGFASQGRRRFPATRHGGGGPIACAESVSKAINQFSPRRLSPEVWGRVEALVRASVRQAEPISVYDARSLLNVVTQLAVWVDQVGQPLEPSVVFHPDTVDRFVLEGLSHLSAGTRCDYRCQLRTVGASVLGPGVYPPRLLPLRRPDIAVPYTPEEVASLVAWCRGLPTARYRDNIAVLLGLGFGAGLTGNEILHLRGGDIVVDRYGVVISLRRGRKRDVPVLRRFADEVAGSGARAGAGLVFAPESSAVNNHKVANFVARCPKGDAPDLNVVRMRVTWLVHHLAARTDIVALTRASGIRATQLAKYASFVSDPDPAEARRQLTEADVL